MKPIGLSIVVKLGISAALAMLSCAAVSAPCTTPTDECSEFVIVSGGPSRSFVYRSLPLNVSNEGVRRALITVHGLGRDADVYFRSALARAPGSGGTTPKAKCRQAHHLPARRARHSSLVRL
jgi:hypothetical protein